MVLTDEEKRLIDEGKISYTELIRQKNQSTHCVDLNALDEVKQKREEAKKMAPKLSDFQFRRRCAKEPFSQ